MGEGIKLPVLNGLGRTNRIDNWWSQPLTMGIGLTAAMIYTFWRLFLYGTEAANGNSLISYDLHGSTVMSPIFSPTCSSGNSSDSMSGTTPKLGQRCHPRAVDSLRIQRHMLLHAPCLLPHILRKPSRLLG